MYRCPPHVIVLASILVAASVKPLPAAVYRVGSGAGCTHATIQAAITAAAASSAADDILISGTSHANQALTIDHVQGALALVGGYADCQSATPTLGARTVIGGTSSQGVVRVQDSAFVELLNLDIQNGHAAGSGGGGIRARGGSGATLRLFNTLVRVNQATYGGGIAIENPDTAAAADEFTLRLEGDTRVLSNAASATGGGIHCLRAAVRIADDSHLGLNTSDGYGGGLFAHDCRVSIGSRGINGAVVWGNQAIQKGGGMYVLGTRSVAEVHTVAPTIPARVVGNSAAQGAGVAALAGASLWLFDAIIEQNTATSGGAAILVEGDQEPGHYTYFSMRHILGEGAPVGAVNCADSEACNLVRDNRAVGTAGATQYGVALDISSGTSRVEARFRGTRFDRNVGRSLSHESGDNVVLRFNSALIANNELSSSVFHADSASSQRALVVEASTVADNKLGADDYVIVGAGNCALFGVNPVGTWVRHSIFRDGAVLIPDAAPQDSCFTHLIADDFGALPSAAHRVVADPRFVDAQSGDYRLAPTSPAVDFAPAISGDVTRDGGPRVFDVADRTNLFGPQDLGAYERVPDRIYFDGFDCSGC